VGNHVLLDAPANLGLRPPAELDGHDDFRHLGTAGDLADIDELRPYVRDSDVLVLGVRTAESSHLLVSEPLPSSVFAGLDGFRIHVDIDVLDPAHVSAVDSPAPGGLDPDTPVSLLRRMLASPGAVGFRRRKPVVDAQARGRLGVVEHRGHVVVERVPGLLLDVDLRTRA
jgi:arginase